MTPALAIAATEQTEGDEALARFQAQWPADRCKLLADAVCGTPAEREAAALRIAARAMEHNATTPADHAVRGLLTDTELVATARQHRAFNRLERRAGGSR